MAKEPNLIKKHMLDGQLREEIDSMAKAEDVRAKADAITLDDLDPDVRARVLNNPVSPNAYDDTDLRNRVITLESAKMDANIAFNKNTDVVTRDMLNADLQQVTDAARNVVNKIDADIVENGYRKLSVPIEESDMSEDFQDKFTRTIQKVNNLSIDSSNVAGVTEQIAVLREDVATLSRDKISIEYGNEHYRLRSEPIPIIELETDAQEAINGIGTINETLQNKANTSYVDGHFRRTDVAITKNDLDINLQSDIDIAARAANDVRDAAEAVIDSYYFETILPSFITTYGTTASADLGTNTSDAAQRAAFRNKTASEQVDIYLNYIYPYSFYHKVAAAAGTLNLPNTDNRAGKATFTAFFNWVYEQLMALDSEEIADMKEKIENIDFDALEDIDFSSLNEQLNAINQSLQNIEERLTALEENNTQQQLQSINERLTALEEDHTQQLQSINERLTALEENNG